MGPVELDAESTEVTSTAISLSAKQALANSTRSRSSESELESVDLEPEPELQPQPEVRKEKKGKSKSSKERSHPKEDTRKCPHEESRTSRSRPRDTRQSNKRLAQDPLIPPAEVREHRRQRYQVPVNNFGPLDFTARVRLEHTERLGYRLN